MIGAPLIKLRANQFKVGDPPPSGSRALTSAEVMAYCDGNRKLAKYAIMKFLLVPTLNARGEPCVVLLGPGDWVVRLNNGNIAVVTDEQFRRQFRVLEGK